MSNEAVLAILALPDPRRPDDPEGGVPERQLRFLLALSTFTRKDGWREAGIRLLARKANQSPTTAAKARGELIRAELLDYVRGKGRALSRYQIKAPGVDDHLAQESASVAGTQAIASVAGTQTGTVEYQPAVRSVPTGPDLSTSPNSSSRANAAGSFKALGSNHREEKQLRPIDVIKHEIKTLLGEPLTDRWASKIERLLRDRGIATVRGLQVAIQNEANPRLTFLSQDGEHRPPRPVPELPAAPAETGSSDEGHRPAPDSRSRSDRRSPERNDHDRDPDPDPADAELLVILAPQMTKLLEILDGTASATLMGMADAVEPKPLNARGHIDFRTRAAKQWFPRWEDLVMAGCLLIEAGLAEVLDPADGTHPDVVGITAAGRRYLAEAKGGG